MGGWVCFCPKLLTRHLVPFLWQSVNWAQVWSEQSDGECLLRGKKRYHLCLVYMRLPLSLGNPHLKGAVRTFLLVPSCLSPNAFLSSCVLLLSLILSAGMYLHQAGEDQKWTLPAPSIAAVAWAFWNNPTETMRQNQALLTQAVTAVVFLNVSAVLIRHKWPGSLSNCCACRNAYLFLKGSKSELNTPFSVALHSSLSGISSPAEYSHLMNIHLCI